MIIIESKSSNLLDELYANMRREHIDVNKNIKEIKDAQGDITLYLSIATLALESVSTFIDVLTYFNNKHTKDKNHYIHVLFKDGRDFEFENLSEEEKIEKLKILRDNFEQIERIKIG